jgi:hypothetical protein
MNRGRYNEMAPVWDGGEGMGRVLLVVLGLRREKRPLTAPAWPILAGSDHAPLTESGSRHRR